MTTSAKKNPATKFYAITIAVITWFSVLLQLYLTTGTITNFFSYFTILSNLLVAISLSFSALLPNSNIGKFFSRLSVQSAIALYIFIVFLVYNLILRSLWAPQGWQLLVDNLLHVIVPILYILYWLFLRATGILKWQDGIYWLLFPLLYLLYTLVRGAIVQWYPYPFLNAATLGYGRVAFNVVAMLSAFLVAGMLLIFITRLIKQQKEIAL